MAQSNSGCADRACLQFADKVANGAMPAMSATPEYLVYRKLDVYRAAFESLYAGAAASEKERAMLDRLRMKLCIQAADAQAIEEQVQEEMTGKAAAQ